MHHHGDEIDPIGRPPPFRMAEPSDQMCPTGSLYAETVQRKRERKQPELQPLVVQTPQAGTGANFFLSNREPR